MKGKKLVVAFVDNEQRVYSIDMAEPEEIDKAIKELSNERNKRIKK